MNTKKIITTCLLLLGAMALQAQELKPFKADNGKYGYKDQNGKIIIEPKYDNARHFSDGVAAVSLGGPTKSTVDNLNPIMRGKLIFIDKTGKEVLSFPAYPLIDANSEDLYNIDDFSEDLAAFEKKGKGYLDKTGKIIIPVRPYHHADKFSDGLARVSKIEKGKGFSFGFIDKKGNEVIPLKYSNAEKFFEGLAAVQLNNKWGFINNTGKEIIPIQYDFVSDNGLFSKGFKDGKVKVKKDGREFYIDKTGKEIEDDNAVFQKMATAYQSGNFAEAFKLAEQLANKHNADAMNLLGNMYAQGQGTRQNYGMARSWWEMASNKGNAAATGNIGLLYAQGWGVPQNMAEAEKWFKKGADLGDPQSMFNLGNLAFQKGNLKEAKQWIQKAKTAGHPQADVALQQINAASANQQQPRREKN